MNFLTPEVSAWYQDLKTGALFEVVAYDENSDSIDYQHVDGEVGEYDRRAWRELLLVPASAPEDWRTPYELNSEDSDYYDKDIVPENWSGPLTDIEPDAPEDFDD